jgi:VWFA-related protein
MKRTIALILLLVGLTLSAHGAKRVTVAELEQVLEGIHGKTDGDVAWQVANLQLTERLTDVPLARMQIRLPGEQSRQALRALADQVAFLDPPAAELPVRPGPDFAEQRRIMGLVVGYVGNAIPRLPNFFATRDTARFEDTPQLQTPGSFVPYAPLHFVNRSQATVLYREGREVEDTGVNDNRKSASQSGSLTTWGVFGPILSTVLLDAAKSKLTWSHWEQGPAGVEAVFSYSVPKEKSHYEVNYCCVAEIGATEVAHVHPFRQIAAYHGVIAVDPASGAIVRLVVEAELKPTDPVSTADILVEYREVEIAGKKYICPARSVSSAVAQTIQVDPLYKFPLARQMQPLKTSINEVAFENYHVFRSDARVLTGEEANLAQISNARDPAAALPPVAASAVPSLEGTKQVQPPSPSTDSSGAQPLSAAETASPAPPAAIPAPEPPVPEIEVAAATGFPDTPLLSKPPDPESGVTLRTTARLVDVALVAIDKKGRPVTDLKPEDLEVYDNGQKQAIRFFSQAGAQAEPVQSAPPASQATQSEPASFTNRPASTGPTLPSANADTTVLLIDAANVAFSDLTYARSEMLRFLKTLASDERVGLYILQSHGFQILLEPTPDHQQVATVLTHWMPSAQDLARAQDEEQRNRQQFDWVHNASDLANVNGNGQGGSDPEMYSSGKGVAAAAGYPPDAELRPLGNRPEDFALHLLVGVGRHLGAIPGHKILVWISSDNALADFSGQTVGREDTGNRFLDPASMRARETLNEAHVSIYPLDVSQLEASGIGADLRNRNIDQVGYTDRSQESAVVGDQSPANKNGRDTARMQQDTHPIQGVFRDLADATGGRALRRAGDIAAELDSVVADGRAAYLLSFAPDGPADDHYHALTVKLVNRRNLILRYRTGYLYSKEPATLKERFRQSIWQPRDVGEIGVTATPMRREKGATLSLNIAATDLELAQQHEHWVDQVGIFLALRDDSGLHARITGQSLQLRLAPATYQKALRDGIPFNQLIKDDTNFNSVRVVVVDENSGRMGSVTVPATALRRTP